jgi:hypothetical protein
MPSAGDVACEPLTGDEIKQEVRAMYQTVFNDDPDDDEVKYRSKLLRKHALRLARKGFEGEDVESGASARAEEKLMEQPFVTKHIEEEEENTELRDGLVSMAQAISALG